MVYLLRTKGGKTQVLLQKRGQKTHGCGLWEASAAGHVDKGESMTACAVRETREEIGVSFTAKDIAFSTIIHANSYDTPYYNGHFFVAKWMGEPRICEHDKCECLEWHDLDNVPTEMFADRNTAIQNFKNKKTYSEVGWN